MKVELPETISLPDKKRKPIKVGFTGHVTLPDEWNGGDYEDLFNASESDNDDTIWERQWVWAKERIVEWAIKDLPTNPNQINDNEDLTWALMSFLSSSAIAGMNDYMKEGVEEVKEQFGFPVPDDLRPGEFLAWHKAQKAAGDGDDKSNILKSWLAGKILVREWPNGEVPKDDRSVDLRMMLAVDELLAETMVPSLNLGNWSAPLGGP